MIHGAAHEMEAAATALPKKTTVAAPLFALYIWAAGTVCKTRQKILQFRILEIAPFA
jgi:hypothetical protein